MKKSLHIIDSMGLGGTQTVVKGIFEGQKDGNNIFLYALRKKNINIQINHNNIFYNDSINKLTFPIFKLKKFIKENNINILHCHLVKSQVMGFFLKKLFFPNIILIFHEHGKIFKNGIIYPNLISLFEKKVNLYFAVSKATEKQILKKTNFEENKINVLYNFVDLDKFKKIENFDRQKERKKYGLNKDDFVVGFGARFIKRKGWEEFLKSAKILIEEGHNFKFVIGGDGKDEEKIKNFIEENNLEENIKLIGYINNMINFYNILNCFIISSHWEPMGLTQLEAQACGVSVIVSNVEGLNETVNDNKDCLLFESNNYQELKDKILEIYKNEELKDKLIKGGFENVKKFSLKKYIIDLNKIYENV